MKRSDLFSGLGLAAVGIFVIQQARSLTYRDEFGPGPGLLPFWLGILLTALAVGLVISTLTRRSAAPSSSGRGKTEDIPLPPGEGRVRVAGLYPQIRMALAWLAPIAM